MSTIASLTTAAAASHRPPHVDLSQIDAIPDELILDTILRAIVRTMRARAYYAVFVPQVGKHQGEAIYLSSRFATLPADLKIFIRREAHALDLSRPHPRETSTRTIAGVQLTTIDIASHYNIDLGRVYIVHEKRIVTKQLCRWLDLFEGIIAFRKEARALGHHSLFFGLDQKEREGLDQNIGEIVHSAIHPHRTMIFVPHENEFFRASFISGVHPARLPNAALHVGKGRNQLTLAYDERRAINVAQIATATPRAGFERYAAHHGFGSCLITPVVSEMQCFCLIVCFFKRANAVSDVEKRIVSSMAGLLSDYYRLWYRNNEVERSYAEADEVLKQVRELLLIVDVLHDAAEDLATARGHLGMLDLRDKERETLDAAKSILSSLITATNHFKSFYRQRDGRGVAERVGSTQAPFRPDEITPYAIIGDIEKKYRGQLMSSKIQMTVHCARDFRFWGVEHCVRRAIDNAVKNSIYHLQRKSHIRREISVHVRADAASVEPGVAHHFTAKMIVIEVADNGPGIEANLLGTVRQRYVSHRGGMGLGVPIMEAACVTHGGRLELASEWGRDFRATMRFREMVGGS